MQKWVQRTALFLLWSSGPLSTRCRRPRPQGHSMIARIINNKRDCCGLKTSDNDLSGPPDIALALSSLYFPLSFLSPLCLFPPISPPPHHRPGRSRGWLVAGARTGTAPPVGSDPGPAALAGEPSSSSEARRCSLIRSA